METNDKNSDSVEKRGTSPEHSERTNRRNGNRPYSTGLNLWRLRHDARNTERLGPLGPYVRLRQLSREAENAESLKQTQIHNQGLQEFYALRSKWSNAIINWISCWLTVSTLILLLVICGAFSKKMETNMVLAILGTTLVQTLGQVVGMALLAVKFFHPSETKGGSSRDLGSGKGVNKEKEVNIPTDSKTG